MLEVGLGALLALEALLGSLTPLMANISRPINPWRSQMNSTWLNTWAMSFTSMLMKWEMVVKCGQVSQDSAMKAMRSRQARSMARLLTMPWL